MSSEPSACELVVIGAGPGGYAAAFRAADLGIDVTLVDPEARPGGVCLYRGCIPSKALLHLARVMNQARAASEWGIHFGAPQMDLQQVRQWKDQVVAKLTGGLGGLTDSRGVAYVRGVAAFDDHRTVSVQTVEGGLRRLRFRQAIIATGSVPVGLPGLSFESKPVWNSKDAVELSECPDRLLVVGGGYIGLEMATVYHALGSNVTVVEATDGLLPGVDRDLVGPLAIRLGRQLEAVWRQTRVVDAHEVDGGIDVVFDGGDLDGKHRYFDRILVAVGRRPRTEGLGLEHTRVEVGADGFIAVDSSCRTTDPHIFAIGDAASEPMLAHKAHHQGRVAAEVIAGGQSVFEPRAIPAVVFTDPEVAWCGLTEDQSRTRGRQVKIGDVPWSASARAATMGRADGLTKVVVDAANDRLLGVGLSGPGAGELVAEATLAIEMGARPQDLQLTIHPHPTLSETLMEAAEAVHGRATHVSQQHR